jgi:hypothetical protein
MTNRRDAGAGRHGLFYVTKAVVAYFRLLNKRLSEKEFRQRNLCPSTYSETLTRNSLNQKKQVCSNDTVSDAEVTYRQMKREDDHE